MACSDRNFGKMKLDVANTLVSQDCQEIATLAEFPPATQETKAKNGLTLLAELQGRGVFSEQNLDGLIDILRHGGKMEAASIVETYRNEHPISNAPGQAMGCTSPDYSKCHMNTVVPDSKLSELSKTLGDKFKPFALQKLNLKEADVNNCEYKKNSQPETVYAVLYHWKQTVGLDATYKNLAQKLFDFKFGETVWKILETPPELNVY